MWSGSGGWDEMKPQTKAAELIEHLQQQALEPNEFQLRVAEREAKAVLKHDATQGYVILGIINAIRGDYAASVDYHQKAIRISNDYWTNRQFLSSLFNMKCWQEAMIQADLLLKDFSPVLPDVPMVGIQAAIRAGYAQKASLYRAALVKLSPNEDDNGELAQMINTANMLTSTGLSDAEMGEMNQLAEQVAQDMGATIVSTYTWANVWEEPFNIINEYLVTGADTADMVFELADRVATLNPPAFQKGGYHVTFTPAPVQKNA